MARHPERINDRQLLKHQGSDDRSYAMAGAGGSIGMADPTLGLGSPKPNQMDFGSPTDPGEVELRATVYRRLGGRPQSADANTD